VPTKNPRVNTVLEPPLFQAVERLARSDGVSLSEKVRDLVREAVELVEDERLEAIARDRRTGAPTRRWLSGDEVRRRLKLR
jgi:hypothetical protein